MRPDFLKDDLDPDDHRDSNYDEASQKRSLKDLGLQVMGFWNGEDVPNKWVPYGKTDYIRIMFTDDRFGTGAQDTSADEGYVGTMYYHEEKKTWIVLQGYLWVGEFEKWHEACYNLSISFYG